MRVSYKWEVYKTRFNLLFSTFENACTKSEIWRFRLMCFIIWICHSNMDFPFWILLGVQYFCYFTFYSIHSRLFEKSRFVLYALHSYVTSKKRHIACFTNYRLHLMYHILPILWTLSLLKAEHLWNDLKELWYYTSWMHIKIELWSV